ncbi:MAG: alpha/beta family hydrolase [Mariniblastus sp.]
MKTKKLKFVAHPSKGNVSAIFQMPNDPIALMVLGHGAGAGMTHANMEKISATLLSRGIATFRYQFPFMEKGGGRDSKQVSLATVENAVLAATKLAPKIPTFAGGHSFGGRMTSLAAAEQLIDQVDGLIFFAFPLHPSGKPSIERADHLPTIKKPMLFLSGTRDKLFTVDLFTSVLKKLQKKNRATSAQLHLLDTADHSYKILKRTRNSDEDVFEEMSRVAHHWIEMSI